MSHCGLHYNCRLSNVVGLDLAQHLPTCHNDEDFAIRLPLVFIVELRPGDWWAGHMLNHSTHDTSSLAH